MAVLLYMDVHVDFAITVQLRRRGVDVLTAQDDGSNQLKDDELLNRSTSLGRVMVTNDIRFRAMAEDWQRHGIAFGGLVFGHPMHCTIGQFVKDLEIIAKASDPSDWTNIVERLPL